MARSGDPATGLLGLLEPPGVASASAGASAAKPNEAFGSMLESILSLLGTGASALSSGGGTGSRIVRPGETIESKPGSGARMAKTAGTAVDAGRALANLISLLAFVK